MKLIDLLLVFDNKQKVKIILRSVILSEKYVGIVSDFDVFKEKYIINRNIFCIKNNEDILEITIV